MAEGDLFDERVASATNVIFQNNYANENEVYTKTPQWWNDQEDIVISGLSGRFPESNNVKEFMENLFAGVNMVTEDNRRWDPGYYGLPKCQGKIKDLTKFDAEFFGFNANQATDTDPQIRLLLETAYECLYDAGVNPFKLRGTTSGIFLGNSQAETSSIINANHENIHSDALNGTMNLMAHRLIYHLDFKGPCMNVDAACSSSLLALQLAVDAIRTGQCDQAIVAGAHLTLVPYSPLGYMALGMLSPESKCHSFDAAGYSALGHMQGDGYVRSECVGCIFLQKKSTARRVYATVLHAKSNTDGFKEQGISFPSAIQQINLLKSTYKEAGIDPKDVTYVEAHGTGTKVGDPVECHAIKTVFVKNRNEPLLIGSVKSNAGHAEPSSGIMGLTKVIIAMESGIIPQNIHLQQANPFIPALTDGSLKVVDTNTKWQPGLVGISSFGFGGSNTHVILNANTNASQIIHFDEKKKDLPILLIHSSQTKEALKNIFDLFEKEHSNNLYLYNILCEQSATPVKLMPYRGYTLIDRRDPKTKPICEIVKVVDNLKPSIWFIYSGLGSQWVGMGREMMIFDDFCESLSKCSAVVEEFGISLLHLIAKGNELDFKDNPLNSLICIISIQIALTDLLRHVGINEQGIIGHSIGEIVASYADGCTDYKETMLIAYYIGKTISDSNLPPGGMANVYLSLDRLLTRLSDRVFASIKNHNNSVTFAGDAKNVADLANQLKVEGNPVKIINSAGVAFHSPYLQNVSDKMRKALSKVLPNPKARSTKWITSCIYNEKLDTHAGRYSSADFHINNLVSMLNFDGALKRLPKNAIVIEISPDCVLQDVLKRGNRNVGLMSKNENNVNFFLTNLGRLYQYGANFDIQKLYPKVQYPVPRGTPMMSHMFGWKHDKDWKVYTGTMSQHLNCVSSFTIDPFPPDSKDHYMLHHVFDGRPLYSFCGHIFMAWKTICKFNMVDFNKTPVLFENIRVMRATFVTKPIKFVVVVTLANGNFEIMEDGNLCASGRITILDKERNKEPFILENFQNEPIRYDDKIQLTSEDIYKEFHLRGYEYGPQFRGIQTSSNSGEVSTLVWTGHWATFIDSMLQTFFVMEKTDTFNVPVSLRYLRIDPVRHLAAIREIDGTKVIPARSNFETVGCISGGIEACGLVSQTVRRRSHQQKVTFERISFIPLQDDYCMFEYPDQQKLLHLYNDACRSIALSLIKNLVKSVSNFPNRVMFEKIASQGITQKIVENTTNKLTSEKECSLLKLLTDLNQNSFSTNGINIVDKLSAYIKSSLDSLECDKVWNFAWSDHSIISQMGIAIQNTNGSLIKVAVLEPKSLQITKKLHWVANIQPLVEVKFLLIGPHIENLLASEEKSGANITFHSIEIDEEIEMEGIEKNQDIVILDRSLHRRGDIQKYLGKVKQLLRDDGFVLVNEITGNYETAFLIEALNTELPTFPINGVRKFGLFYEHSDWCEIFEKSGFYIIGWSSEQLMTTLYTLKKIPSYTLDPIYLNIDNDNKFCWIEPLQKAIEERTNESSAKTILMVSNEVRGSGALGIGKYLKDEYKNNKTRTLIDLSLKEKIGPPELNINDSKVQKVLKQDLLFNIYRDGVYGNFKHMPISEGHLNALECTEHAYVNTVIPGDLSSLTWLTSDNKYFADKPKNELLSLVAVYYAPLNFRDIMIATGRLPPEVIPKSDRLDFDSLLGLEFCGRDIESGKRVMGIAIAAQGLATTLVIDSRFTFDIPEHWSMEEAATIPLAYSTAFYALLVRGKMRRGETVLIHSGCGSVGLAAITIALAYGCEVFTTVGSKEKKTFLLERFRELDENHICCSRTCEFELQIMQMTAGRGVDSVLNSLTEDKLFASLRCLAQNGRFLEIGKHDMAINSNLRISPLSKNITFHGILLDSLCTPALQPDWLDAVAMLNDHIKKGIVKPLPSTVFEMNQQVEAFRYMAQRKHLGKIMLKIRSEESDHLALPKPVMVKAVRRATCHPEHVYIIVGGLDGFGLELTNWLVSRGCTKLIISGQHRIKSGYQSRCVNAWRKSGVMCTISHEDLSDKAKAQQLINEAHRMGHIGGIFNLALFSNETVQESCSIKNFQNAFAQIYEVLKNFDELTRNLCGGELKWFVLISSLTTTHENAGQSSSAAYAFSNSAAQRIIEKRRYDGLSGNVVQWGAIEDITISNENHDHNTGAVRGTLPQRIGSCLQTMDSILCLNYPMVTSFVKREVEMQKISQDEDVGEAIGRILGISDLSNINTTVHLGDLGLDSLMAIEIKQSLERDFNLVLSLKDIRTVSLAKLRDLAKAAKFERSKSSK